jgi:hypothetical protein
MSIPLGLGAAEMPHEIHGCLGVRVGQIASAHLGVLDSGAPK